MSMLRRWHWMLIGLLLGLAVGGWRHTVEQFFGEPGFSKGAARSFDPRAFEQLVVTPAGGFADFLWGPLTVHPPAPDGTTWVSGRYVAVRTAATVAHEQAQRADDDNAADANPGNAAAPRRNQAKAFYFIAGPMPTPYAPARVPVAERPSDGFTVREYLAAVKKQYPTAAGLEVRYAWWDESLTRAGISGAIGLVIVGGFWPTILWTLCRMGYGPPPRKRDKIDLSGVKGASAAAKDEMAALMSKYGAAGSAAVATERTTTPDPPSEPAPTTSATPHEEKTYRGEFYPVSRPGKPQ